MQDASIIIPSDWGDDFAVILANGSYPTHDIPLSLLRKGKLLCCCDRAGQTAIEHGLSPDAIVGDGDSLSRGMQEKYAGIFHRVEDQNYNDLTKTTRYVASRSYRRIMYVGATGKREDHTIANVMLLATYRHRLGIEPIMVTDYGWFSAQEGTHVFNAFPRQQVSIFNIGCKVLSSTGLKWECYPYATLWEGTLNEATGTSFRIDSDGTYIVYQTFDAK